MTLVRTRLYPQRVPADGGPLDHPSLNLKETKMSKTILITGGSTGFGRDTAETLAKSGHSVFATMRDIGGRNRQHAEALRKAGIKVEELDVTDDASVERGIAAVLKQAGRIDVLVNNAGIGIFGVSEALTTEQVRNQFDVNVIGIHRVTRATLPVLRKQGSGLIINIGSVLGRVVVPFGGYYTATKHAVEAITENFRYELSQLGIDVVLLQPSAYPTSFFANSQKPGDLQRLAEYGELATVQDKIEAGLGESFGTDRSPDPHDVAAAIADLVAQSAGSRPDRVIVGPPYGADAINAHTGAVQAQVLEAMGLTWLTRLKVTPEAA